MAEGDISFYDLLAKINEVRPDLIGILTQPGVWDAVADAIQHHEGNAEYLDARLRETPYYQTTPVEARKWAVQKTLDPATAGVKVQQYTRWVTDAMSQTGTSLASAEGWAYFSSPFYNFLNKAISSGWDQQQIKYQMMLAGPGGGGGEEASQAARVKKMADDYGLPMSDFTAHMYGRSLTGGMTDMNAIQGDIVKGALGLYPGLSDQIQRGLTVRQIADPYLQIAQQELGTDPTTASLTDPKWNVALNRVDPNSGQHVSMSLSDWTSHIRTNQEYGYDNTEQAKTKAAQFATQLSQKMGALG